MHNDAVNGRKSGFRIIKIEKNFIVYYFMRAMKPENLGKCPGNDRYPRADLYVVQLTKVR